MQDLVLVLVLREWFINGCTEERSNGSQKDRTCFAAGCCRESTFLIWFTTAKPQYTYHGSTWLRIRLSVWRFNRTPKYTLRGRLSVPAKYKIQHCTRRTRPAACCSEVQWLRVTVAHTQARIAWKPECQTWSWRSTYSSLCVLQNDESVRNKVTRHQPALRWWFYCFTVAEYHGKCCGELR